LAEEPAPPKNGTHLERLEHLEHWWREPLAGLIAVAVGCFDIWKYGSTAGFSSSLDEILLLTGIALIAGVKNLFGGEKPRPPPPS
jgi:hypothetical protein